MLIISKKPKSEQSGGIAKGGIGDLSLNSLYFNIDKDGDR